MSVANFGANQTPFNFIRVALRARVPLSVVALVMGAFGLLFGLFGVDGFLQPLEGRPSTHPFTGFCVVALGLSALMTQRLGPGPLWQTMLLSAVITLCSARIMNLALSASTGAEPAALFGPILGFQATFSFEAAATLGAFAAALLARQDNSRWGAVFLSIGLALVFASVLQVTYGLPILSGELGAFTFLAELALGGAVLSIYVHRPFVRVAFLSGEIGSQARIMAAAVIFVPWLSGLVFFMLSDATTEMELAVSALIAVISCAMMVLLLATASRSESMVNARMRAERGLGQSPMVDRLTGVLNRKGLTECLEAAWLDQQTNRVSYGVLMVEAGDDRLEHVAQSLQAQLRGRDVLGRWDGATFLLVLAVKDTGDLLVVARRLRAALADAVFIGVSHLDGADVTVSDAVRRADHNLHLAKIDAQSGELGYSTAAAWMLDGQDDMPVAFEEAAEGADHRAA